MSYVVNPVTSRPFPLQTMVNGQEVLPDFLARVPTASGAFTILAPEPTAVGVAFAVEDVDGSAATNPITIDGNGNTIDGAASAALSANGVIAIYVFDGGAWRRQLVPRRFDDEDPEVGYRSAEQPPAAAPGSTGEVLVNSGGLIGAAVNVVAGTDYVAIGANPATSGRIRFPHVAAGSVDLIRSFASAVVESPILRQLSGGFLRLGHEDNWDLDLYAATLSIWGKTATVLYGPSSGPEVARMTSLGWEQSGVRLGRTSGGTASPYASEGRADQAMADANQAPGASVYSRSIIRMTGACTASRTLTLPHPASEDASYEKTIYDDTTGGFGHVVSTGTGTTFEMWPGARVTLRFTPAGVAYTIADGSPLGFMGRTLKAMANANQALSASEVRRFYIRATGAHTAIRTLSGFPQPGQEEGVVARFVENATTGGFAITLSNGGATLNVAAGGRILAGFSNAGVFQILP